MGNTITAIQRGLARAEDRPPFCREVPPSEFHLYENEARLADQIFCSGVRSEINENEAIWIVPAMAEQDTDTEVGKVYKKYRALMESGRPKPKEPTIAEKTGGSIQAMILKYAALDGKPTHLSFKEIEAIAQDPDYLAIPAGSDEKTQEILRHYVDEISWRVRSHIGMILYANREPPEEKSWLESPLVAAAAITLVLALPFVARNGFWLASCGVRLLRRIPYRPTPWLFQKIGNFTLGLLAVPAVYVGILGTDTLMKARSNHGFLEKLASKLETWRKQYILGFKEGGSE